MNEDTPNETPETPDTVIDRLLPSALAKLERQIEEGGKKSVRHTCASCGKRDTIEVDTGADPEMLIKAASMLSAAKARAKAGEDESSAAAVKLMHDRSEMSDAELAEYIAKLRAELE